MHRADRCPRMHRLASLLGLGLLAACGGSSSPKPPPTPAPAAPAATSVPCFPDRTEPLAATDMYKQLEKHAMGWMMPEDERPPPEA